MPSLPSSWEIQVLTMCYSIRHPPNMHSVFTWGSVLQSVRTSPQSCSCSCCHRSTLCWPAGSWLTLPVGIPQPCPSPRSSGCCCCRPYPPSCLWTLLRQTHKKMCQTIRLCVGHFKCGCYQLSGISCRTYPKGRYAFAFEKTRNIVLGYSTLLSQFKV